MIKTANQEFFISTFYGYRDIKMGHFIFYINLLNKIVLSLHFFYLILLFFEFFHGKK